MRCYKIKDYEWIRRDPFPRAKLRIYGVVQEIIVYLSTLCFGLRIMGLLGRICLSALASGTQFIKSSGVGSSKAFG